MTASIPETHKDLLEKPIVVTLVTLMPDNQPQATPVWFSFDGTHIWINTAKGRAKANNMLERPRVTILSVDPQNPYRYIEVRGTVEEVTEVGGVDHINALSARYTGKEDYYKGVEERKAIETRVIYKIKPVRVIAN